MSNDPRIAYGAQCSWWDSIDKVGHTDRMSGPHTLPCCPKCGGMLFEVDSIQQWWTQVDQYDKGHSGYREFVEWLRGKCFKSWKLGAKWYIEETGKKVDI
jgi:hypothetical protein